MTDRSMLNPALGDSEGGDEAGELLQISLRPLLDRLGQMRRMESMAALRVVIDQIRRLLDDEESELYQLAGEHASVALAESYLLGELEQIAAAQTIERAHYYLDRLIKSLTEVRTSPINDINLNRWKEYEDIITDSLWIIERRDRSGVHRADYWGNFIPQIPQQMLRRYTKRGEWVLDPFAGSGTTLLEGQRLGRHTIGVELQQEMVERARRLIAAEPNPYGVTSEVIAGDSTTIDFAALLRKHDQRSAQLAIIHPPYFDIIKFSADPRDLSNTGSVEQFLALLGRVTDNILEVLDRDRYLVLVIGDKYARGEWIPLGFLAMNELLQRSLVLKSIAVKNFEETTGKRHQHELWRYRALAGGFYVFKHEYIFIFKRS